MVAGDGPVLPARGVSAGGAGRDGRLVRVAVFVLVTAWAFPQLVLGEEVDLGLVLGWLAPAALVWVLAGLAPARAARLGFVCFWLAHALVCHWFYVVAVRHGGASPLVGVLATFAATLYFGLFGAFFGFAYAALERRGRVDAFVFAVLWLCIDHLRSFLFGGFPWATLGYSQHRNAWLLPIASYAGVYGLSFLLALAGAALAGVVAAWRGGHPLARRDLAALALVAVLHASSALRGLGPEAGGGQIAAGDGARAAAVTGQGIGHEEGREPPRTLRVAAIQGDIAQEKKWSAEGMRQALDTYERLSRQAAEAGARLILWPETAVPGALELEDEVETRLRRLARTTGTGLIVGSVGVDVDWAEREIERYYDSAFAIDAGAGIAWRYDKSHLVPFGEYVPLRPLIGWFFRALATGISPNDVTPGDGPVARAVHLEDDTGLEWTLRAGVPICYELLFPNLVRGFASDGAGLLLAMTNDGWYGRTGAPYQFLAITAMRSAETGLWTVRAANTGVSAIIDGDGRVRSQTSIFEPGFVIDDVPISSGSRRRTFYVRYGDWLPWLAWALLGTIAIRARRRSAAPREGIDESGMSRGEG